jgi:hypothetical protein
MDQFCYDGKKKDREVCMKREEYKPRMIDQEVENYLRTFGAVCIEGPKWCGKTWTSSYHAKSSVFIGDPAGNFQNRMLAQLDPGLILDGEPPKLIDEWQEVPPIWDAVRYRVDQSHKKGQFILTGSATPNHKGILHSGAGRIGRIRMRPMSLFEAGASSGKVSLKELCEGNLKPVMTGEVKLTDLIDAIVRGGWPASLDLPLKQAALLPAEYLRAVIEDDIYRLDGIKRDEHKMHLLLRSLARNESTTVSCKKLQSDIKETDSEDVDMNTVKTYLDLFSRLFLLDNQKPFSANMRSSVRVKQAQKRHFSDPSLACALLKATPQMLLNNLHTLGFLFESLCDRDLKIYAQSFGAEVYHYQDYKGREIDSVLQLEDGSWCAFEIKLGAHQIDAAAENLLKIQREFEKDPQGKPAKILCVICGMSSAAYQREDGVYVVPITALKN